MKVLIVGGGLAGLACAVRLHESGHAPLILEASDDLGGRVRTDEVDGFLLDRGFQVYLDAYPEAGKLLDLPALDLRPFEPGALVFKDGKLHRVTDPFRRPTKALESALAPIGSLADKLRVARLRFRNPRDSDPDQSTETFLLDQGFSRSMIDGFFRSFYGGIFLENELRTSSRMFGFTFKIFSTGHATLPAHGMREIPRQLAARLPAECIRLHAAVERLDSSSVTLAGGESLAADAVVLATDVSTAARLLPGAIPEPPAWRSVTNLYYASGNSPVGAPVIALNGSGSGRVNNVCVLSDVVPGYAPPGRHLISVSVLGLPDAPDLATDVRRELAAWFGPTTHDWRHLRSDRIEKALPEQLPGAPVPPVVHQGVHLCGDHLTSASIEGAIVSGLRAAGRIAGH